MHGHGRADEIADNLSPRQILLIFEETWKHVRRRDADLMLFTRAAYHADDIKPLLANLTPFDAKQQNAVSPMDLVRMLKGG